MNPSPQEFPDELISAYLDGELSPEDKARVEDLLIDSPEHRRLFEELKSLRTTLHSLPSYELGQDFAKRVIQKAEREMLTGAKNAPHSAAEPGDANSADEPSSAPPVLPTPATGSHEGSWRGVVWAVAALAAALAVALTLPLGLQNGDPANIAARPADDTLSEAARPEVDQFADEEEPTAELREQPAAVAANGSGGQSATPSMEFVETVPAETVLPETPPAEMADDDRSVAMAAEAEMSDALPRRGVPFGETGLTPELQESDALAQNATSPFGEGQALNLDDSSGDPTLFSQAGPSVAPALPTNLLVDVRMDSADFDRVLEECHIAYSSPNTHGFDSHSLESYRSPLANSARQAAAAPSAVPAGGPLPDTAGDVADLELAPLGDSPLEGGRAGGSEQAKANDSWVVVEASPEIIEQLLAQLQVDAANVSVVNLSSEDLGQQAALQPEQSYQQYGSQQELEHMLAEAGGASTQQQGVAEPESLSAPQSPATGFGGSSEGEGVHAFAQTDGITGPEQFETPADSSLEESEEFAGEIAGDGDIEESAEATAEDSSPHLADSAAEGSVGSRAEPAAPPVGRAVRVQPRRPQMAGREAPQIASEDSAADPQARDDDANEALAETISPGSAGPHLEPFAVDPETVTQPPLVRVLFRVEAP